MKKEEGKLLLKSMLVVCMIIGGLLLSPNTIYALQLIIKKGSQPTAFPFTYYSQSYKLSSTAKHTPG